MKFKINRDHFSNGLAQVLNVVGSKATMPILSNVLIEADEEYLSLTTTNLDLGIRCRIKATVTETGAITLPVRRLATIVRELPALDVDVATTKVNHVKITSGASSFRIVGMEKDEFPPLPEFSDERQFDLGQEELTGMLKSVSYAQSSDETRYILNGVYFRFEEGKLILVATDGRRLALVSRDLEIAADQGGSLILPAKTVSELVRLLGKGERIKVAFNERRVAFQVETSDEENGFLGDILLVSKVVEGNYPNYQQVIPKETHQRIKVERELFLQSVHRAALVTSEKSNSVKIKLSNNLLEILASSSDFGEAHEKLAVTYEGPDLQVAFNPQFVMDPLRALTRDEVAFEVKDEVSPGVFKTSDSFLCVIMPVRLS
ncbi:MAG: DNA polymerase III subunit beta [Verrucomicrobia bacterium]|nr:MAG: DNA polymerase III subunit beta [Verrucomicrobiota bacterium]